MSGCEAVDREWLVRGDDETGIVLTVPVGDAGVEGLQGVGIERDAGLVEEDEAGVAEEGEGDGEFFEHATGISADELIEVRLHAKAFDPVGSLCGSAVFGITEKTDHFPAGEEFREEGFGVCEVDALAKGFRVLMYIELVIEHDVAFEMQEAADGFEQRAFAGAVGAFHPVNALGDQ